MLSNSAGYQGYQVGSSMPGNLAIEPYCCANNERHFVDGRGSPRFQAWLLAQEQTAVYPSRLTVRSGDRALFIAVDDVDYIEAAGNYAILHVGAVNHILRETLMNLEARLSPKNFFRVNRSALVNLHLVQAVRPAMRGDHVVVLTNGKELSLTRGAREIQQRLEFL